jgi:hypothetical protein
MMAGIILHHEGRGSMAEDDDDDKVDDAFAALDLSRDGHISKDEIRNKVKFVGIRADMLYERIQLERDLANAMLKLANFWVYTLCFITALGMVAPAESIAGVHSFLYQHFQLDRAKSIKDISGIYKYMEDFEMQNEHLQATSAIYWCESRYFSLEWDYHAATPVKKCASPRLYTLYGSSNPSGSPWGGGHGSSAGHGSSSGDGSSSGGHRRMSEDHVPITEEHVPSSFEKSRNLLSNRRLAGGGGGVTHAIGECQDDDVGLAHALHIHHNISCTDYAPEFICGEEAGLLHCRLYCGYCAPFKYERVHKFPYPVVSMLPSMVYQERFKTKHCHGYAESYLHQSTNPALVLLPTLDGARDSDLLICIDRETEYDEEYAHKVKCPMCDDGYHYDTAKHLFHGAAVYPKFMVEAHKDIEIMNTIGWIDVQTKDVVLSTSLYTEGSELFTFLSVTFIFDEAGGIQGSYKITTIKDLMGTSKHRFVAFMFMTMASVGLALVRSAALLIYELRVNKRSVSDIPGQALEVFTQALLISFVMAMLLGWTQQEYVHNEYDEMLHSFLELKELSHKAFEEVVDHFFEVKTHVYYTTAWYSRHYIVSYCVIYVQFVQLIMYFNVHPRMALLTNTIKNGIDHMFHFLLLFAILFCFLAFMAHWMFGPDLDIFQTFPQTISEQVRILFGEYLVAGEGMKNLYGPMFGIYVLYFITFMFVVSWTLLNFFLAIVVDAFVIVKEEISGANIHRNFFLDVYDCMVTPLQLKKNHWPDSKTLLKALDQFQRHNKDGSRKTFMENSKDVEDGTVDSEPIIYWRDIRNAFENGALGSKKGAIEFVCYYGEKCNAIIRVNGDLAGTKPPSAGTEAKAEATKDSDVKSLPKIPDKVEEIERADQDTKASEEIELSDKEQALFLAGMKALTQVAMKLEPYPLSSSEAEWDAMIANIGVQVCRELQHCSVFKEDDELSV